MELMTVADVAAVLKVSKLTAWKYIKAGRLKGYKVGGAYRVFPADIEAFVKGGGAE